jgi:hypothetical protein
MLSQGGVDLAPVNFRFADDSRRSLLHVPVGDIQRRKGLALFGGQQPLSRTTVRPLQLDRGYHPLVDADANSDQASEAVRRTTAASDVEN